MLFLIITGGKYPCAIAAGQHFIETSAILGFGDDPEHVCCFKMRLWS